VDDRSPLEAVPPGRRRWLVAMALVRAVGTAALLGVLYFLLPLNGPFQGSGLVLLGLGLAGVVAVVVWQVQAILRSRHPGVQAVEALVASISMLLVVFAATYYELALASGSNFTEPMSRVDALYFTVTTFATVGFGDVAPTSQLARIVVMAQVVADLIVVGAGLRVLVGAVKIGRRRQSERDES
jgi:voltage-gated potassium channel